MADRRRQTLQLLATRDDLRWLPPGALRTRAGLAPAQSRPCPDCGHGPRPGWLLDRFGRATPCRRCGGATEPSGRGAYAGSFVARDGGSGRVWFDPMDAQRVDVGDATSTATARPRATVRCDACNGDGAHGNQRRCDVCGGSGRRDLHAFELRVDLEPGDVDPVDRAIEARDRAGSYRALDLALDELRARSWRLHAALLAAVDAGEPLSARLEVALRFLVDRMPEPIRVPGDVRANELERRRQHERARGTRGLTADARNREIRRLVLRDHRPTQWVAGEFGLSPSQVNRIVAGNVDRG